MVNGQSELAAVGLRDFLATKPAAKYRGTGLRAAGGGAGESPEVVRCRGRVLPTPSKAADLEYLKARYLIDAGRAYREGGKTQEAIAAYREIVQKYPKSPSFTEAQVRLAELTDGKM